MSLCSLQLTNLRPAIPTLMFLFSSYMPSLISRSGTGALRDVPTPPGVEQGTKLGDVLC